MSQKPQGGRPSHPGTIERNAWYSRRELLKRLGISESNESTFARFCRDHQIPFAQVGRQRFVSGDDVCDALARIAKRHGEEGRQ